MVLRLVSAHWWVGSWPRASQSWCLPISGCNWWVREPLAERAGSWRGVSSCWWVRPKPWVFWDQCWVTGGCSWVLGSLDAGPWGSWNWCWPTSGWGQFLTQLAAQLWWPWAGAWPFMGRAGPRVSGCRVQGSQSWC